MADSKGGGKVESECERQKGRGRARWLRGGKEGEKKKSGQLSWPGPPSAVNVTAAEPQENAEGGGRVRS